MLYHPTPRITQENREYFDACSEGKLLGQRCTRCGKIHCPPAGMCACSLSAEFESVHLVGTGAIYTFSVIHRPPGPEFSEQVPYVLGVVELDEGPRLVSNIVELDPSEIEIGLRVAVRFEPCADNLILVPVFAPEMKHGSRT
ncbi:MAG: Zn-ribbon domain-containing OB-fold protein [Proteobacteria bacterium]|nr:MAG: Zn-ribbon domain-containing OB-fold protein [Pseudomonadota bacterium]